MRKREFKGERYKVVHVFVCVSERGREGGNGGEKAEREREGGRKRISKHVQVSILKEL